MSINRIYMDYTGGKPLHSHVIETVSKYSDSFYVNPLPIHYFGQKSRSILEDARTKIAKLIKTSENNSIVFTSGATESNNMAIKGVAYRNKSHGKHIITSSIEHMSIINTSKFLATQGYKITFLPVNKQGLVDLTKLEEELTDETILVSIMYANGEIGTIQPIKEISKIVHNKKAYLHVDATAANGQVPINVDKEEIDLLTLSSNDMYGPQGVGALYIKKDVRISPIIHGGGQENGLRSGTINIAGVVGFGKAAEIAEKDMKNESKRLKQLRNKLIKGLLTIPSSFLNGHSTKRLPNNAAVRYSFIEGESILLGLDIKGVSASSGSACTAKTLQPSHVLRATGLKHEEAHGSVLFTLGKQNTEKEVKYVINIMPNIVKRLRLMSPLTPKEISEKYV